MKDSQGELSPINADEAALSDATSRVVITENYLVASNSTPGLANCGNLKLLPSSN